MEHFPKSWKINPYVVNNHFPLFLLIGLQSTFPVQNKIGSLPFSRFIFYISEPFLFSFEIHPSKGGNPPWPDPKDSSDSLDFTNHIPRPSRLGVTDKMRIEETEISVSAGNREIIFNSAQR